MASEYLDLGPGLVYWGPSGSEALLGSTHGGIKVKLTTSEAEAKTDQTGEDALKRILTGMSAEVEANLAEVTLANWAKVMPGAELITDSVDPTKQKVVITPPIGSDDLSRAQRLILKRMVNSVASIEPKDWITFPVASPKVDGELVFNSTDQRAIPTLFRCYREENEDGSYGALAILGDETAEAGE